MPCTDPKIGKLKYLHDLIDESTRADFERHLADCADCSESIEHLQLFDASLKQEFETHIPEEDLLDYAIDDPHHRLLASRKEQISFHLARCAACQEVYAEYRDSAVSLRQFITGADINPAQGWDDASRDRVASGLIAGLEAQGLIKPRRAAASAGGQSQTDRYQASYSPFRRELVPLWVAGAIALVILISILASRPGPEAPTSPPEQTGANDPPPGDVPGQEPGQATAGSAAEPESNSNKGRDIASSKGSANHNGYDLQGETRGREGANTLSEVRTISVVPESSGLYRQFRQSYDTILNTIARELSKGDKFQLSVSTPPEPMPAETDARIIVRFTQDTKKSSGQVWIRLVITAQMMSRSGENLLGDGCCVKQQTLSPDSEEYRSILQGNSETVEKLAVELASMMRKRILAIDEAPR